MCIRDRAVIVMIANVGKVPAMFADIFSSAFGAHAAFGAIIGQAIAWGVKRGIYANAVSYTHLDVYKRQTSN